MSLTADDLMGIIGAGADIWASDQQTKLAESKLIALENEAKANRNFKLLSEKNKQDYTAKNALLNNEIEENEGEIRAALDNIQRFDVNARDLNSLGEQDKTKFGEDTLESLGIEYGEDFQYRVQIADDAETQLKYNQNLLKVQNQVIDRLQREYGDIRDLQDEYLKVKDDGLYKGIITRKELASHIRNTPEIFAAKDMEGNIIRPEDTNADGVIDSKDDFETNMLAKAFVSERGKTKGGIDYGYWEKGLEEGAISDALDKLEKPEEEEGKWNKMMGHVFRDIGSTENVLTSYDAKGAGEFYKTSGGKVKDYMGTEKMYADGDSALRLKNELESKISKLIAWGEDSNMESKTTPGSILDMSNQAKITPDSSNSLIRKLHDEVMPTETNQSLFGTGWSSDDMTGIDLRKGWKDQQTQEELLRKYLRAWNLMDKKYPGQWIEYK